jgi:hypothetical protein
VPDRCPAQWRERTDDHIAELITPADLPALRGRGRRPAKDRNGAAAMPGCRPGAALCRRCRSLLIARHGRPAPGLAMAYPGSSRIPSMRSPTMSRLDEYNGDFYAWTLETARLLRTGCLDHVDLEQVAEEIEDMGKNDRRALGSHLKVLMLHLLKWRHQPSHRGVSWRLSIANARDEIAALLADSPSLKTRLGELVEQRYPGARQQAALQTGLPAANFPNACPFTTSQLLDDGYLPD